MSKEFFPPRPETKPAIYAYEDTNPQYKGMLKIGYTSVDVQMRVAQQYPTLRPGKLPYKIVLEESAMRNDGSVFIDHEVHRYLRQKGIKNPDGEWFKCSVKQIKAAIIALKTGEMNEENRCLDFTMRPEQAAAVEKTAAYFKSFRKENHDKAPHFLWNAKMRFGKTFAAYQLAKKMGWKKVLVLTFKPAVQNAWEEDLKYHVDFKGWQFISRKGLGFEDVKKINLSFVLVRFRIIWEKIQQAASRRKTSGFTKSTGIVSSLMNIIMAPGVKMPKNFLKQKIRKKLNLQKGSAGIILTKRSCR